MSFVARSTSPVSIVSKMSNAYAQTPNTSVVIPCFNEEGNLEGLRQKLEATLGKLATLDVVLVDNGSTDSTRAQVKQIAKQLPRTTVVLVDRNMGYGHGIKAGLLAAKGEIVGWTHADLQTDPNDILSGLGLWEEQGGLFIKGRRIGRPIMDSAFSLGMGLLESILFKMTLKDINAQPTLFGREILDEVLSGPDDFSLDLFAMVIARKRGFNEVRFPVVFGKRFSGESNWNTSFVSRWRFIKRTLLFSFQLRKRIKSNVDN